MISLELFSEKVIVSNFGVEEKKAEEIDYETQKQGIYRVGILEYQDFQEIVKKQNKSAELTNEEVYHLDKYFLSVKFCILVEEITEEFVETHFRKDFIIDNYNAIMGNPEDNINPLPDKSLDNDFIADKIDVWNPIFNLLSEPVKKSDVSSKLNDIIQNKKTRQLFSSLSRTKSDRENIKNINNHILNEIGVSIKLTRKQYRLDGKKKEEIYLSLEKGEILLQV